jgi:hypothetical protein
VRPERAAEHVPLLVPRSWKSRTLGHTRPVTGLIYLSTVNTRLSSVKVRIHNVII